MKFAVPVVVAEGHGRAPLRDLRQAIGVIESIVCYRLPRHRQAGPTASIGTRGKESCQIKMWMKKVGASTLVEDKRRKRS